LCCNKNQRKFKCQTNNYKRDIARVRGKVREKIRLPLFLRFSFLCDVNVSNVSTPSRVILTPLRHVCAGTRVVHGRCVCSETQHPRPTLALKAYLCRLANTHGVPRRGRSERGADRPSRFSVGSSSSFRDSSPDVELDSHRANPRWISRYHRWSIVDTSIPCREFIRIRPLCEICQACVYIILSRALENSKWKILNFQRNTNCRKIISSRFPVCK